MGPWCSSRRGASLLTHRISKCTFSLLMCPLSPCFLNHVLSTVIVQEVNSHYLMLSKASLGNYGLDSIFWCSFLNGLLEILFQGRHTAKYGRMTRGFFCPYFSLAPRLPETSNSFTRSARAQQMLALGIVSWVEPVHEFWSQVTETREVLQQVCACLLAQLPNMVIPTLARRSSWH